MPNCSLRWCSHSNRKESLFDLRKQWIPIIQELYGENALYNNKRLKICECHFEPENIEKSGERKRIRYNASPFFVILPPPDCNCHYKSQVESLNKEIESLKMEMSEITSQFTNKLSQITNSLNEYKTAAKHIFTDDQIKKFLAYETSFNPRWSDETIGKALTLRFSAGESGYKTMLDFNYPLPSIRTLQRHLKPIELTDDDNRKLKQCLTKNTAEMRRFLKVRDTDTQNKDDSKDENLQDNNNNNVSESTDAINAITANDDDTDITDDEVIDTVNANVSTAINSPDNDTVNDPVNDKVNDIVIIEHDYCRAETDNIDTVENDSQSRSSQMSGDDMSSQIIAKVLENANKSGKLKDVMKNQLLYVKYNNIGNVNTQFSKELLLEIKPKETEPEKRMVIHETVKTSRYKKKYLCSYPECNKRFFTFAHLKTHESIHSNERPFKCTVEGCDYSSKYYAGLFIHKRLHSEEMQFQCSYPNCTYRTHRLLNLKRHEIRHNNVEPLKCSWNGCDHEFSNRASLTKHVKMHDNFRPFACEVSGCGSRFISHTQLKAHHLIHMEHVKFTCSWAGCDRSFITNEKLQNHILRHESVRPFPCDWPNCGFRGLTHNSLSSHKLKHLSDKPFKCLQCERRFTRETNLKAHIRVVHDKEKIYVCKTAKCGRRFSVRRLLREHQIKFGHIFSL